MSSCRKESGTRAVVVSAACSLACIEKPSLLPAIFPCNFAESTLSVLVRFTASMPHGGSTALPSRSPEPETISVARLHSDEEAISSPSINQYRYVCVMLPSSISPNMVIDVPAFNLIWYAGYCREAKVGQQDEGAPAQISCGKLDNQPVCRCSY